MFTWSVRPADWGRPMDAELIAQKESGGLGCLSEAMLEKVCLSLPWVRLQGCLKNPPLSPLMGNLEVISTLNYLSDGEFFGGKLS